MKDLDNLPLGKRLREPFVSFEHGFRPIASPTPTPPPEEVAGLVERLRGLLAGATEGPWKNFQLFGREPGSPNEICRADNYASGGVGNLIKETDADLIVFLRNNAPALLDAIAALSAQVAGKEEEAERQEELAAVYRRAQLTAEEKLCREQANAAGWKIRAEHLEAENAVLRTGRQGSPSSLLAELTEEEGDELVKFVRSLRSPDVRAAVGLAGGEDGRG